MSKRPRGQRPAVIMRESSSEYRPSSYSCHSGGVSFVCHHVEDSKECGGKLSFNMDQTNEAGRYGTWIGTCTVCSGISLINMDANNPARRGG